MAAKKTKEVVEEKEVVTTEAEGVKEMPNLQEAVDGLEFNLICLANELIEQVRGKQVPNLNDTIDRAIAIYEKVK